MLTRRQFLAGCAGALAATAAYSLVPDFKLVSDICQSIPILLYHRVGAEPDDLTVSISRFRQDMEYLQLAGYESLSLAQVKNHLRGNSAGLPEKPVIITFDDGYLDNYSNAFPLLAQYSMKASFYIITGMMGQPHRMTAAQIREMEAAGMDFGSHTVTHRPLGDLASREAESELAESKQTLEDLLGKAVDCIAYPCGSYTAETLKLVRSTGYQEGFTVRPGFAMFTNRLAIRRMPVFHFDRPLSYVMLRKGLIPDIFG